MATQPATISFNRRVILLVLAIVCFAIDAFLFFAKITASANVEDGLIALGLVFFAAAFL